MPATSSYLEKALLDWALLGAAVTQPPRVMVGLAVGTPGSNNNAASEMGTLTGYLRQTASFGAAASPTGSASNNTNNTFGPFSSVGSVLGIHLWDGSGANSSSMLFYGTLQTARTFGIGDSLVVAAGALTVTMT